VDPEQGGVFHLGREGGRLIDEALDRGPVGGLETDLLDLRQADLGHERVVRLGEPAQRAGLRREEFPGKPRFGNSGHGGSIAGQDERLNGAGAGDDRGGISPRGRDPGQALFTAVFQAEIDPSPVGREERGARVPVELPRQEAGLAPSGRDDRQESGRVPEKLRRDGGDVGDRLPIGAPDGLLVLARVVRQPDHRLALVRVVGGDDPDFGVDRGVGLPVAVADEGDETAVGGPDGLGVVEIAAGDLVHVFRGDVDDVEVDAPAVEVSLVVPLRLETVDDPGFRGAGPGGLDAQLFVLLRSEILLGRVPDLQDHPLAVGGPLVRPDALSHFGQRLGFASRAVQEPDLRFLFSPFGQEGQILPVGAPARTRRRARFGGHRDRIPAAEGDHPDLRLRLFLLEVRSLDQVGHPFSIRADPGVGDSLDPEQVIHGQVARGGLGQAPGADPSREQKEGGERGNDSVPER